MKASALQNVIKISQISNVSPALSAAKLLETTPISQISNASPAPRCIGLLKITPTSQISNVSPAPLGERLLQITKIIQISKEVLLIKRQYEKQFDINGNVESRIKYLEEKRAVLESQLVKMPEGEMLVAPGTTSNSFRYYLRTSPSEKLGSYMDKTRNEDKIKYAKKKYYKRLIININAELEKLNKVSKLQLSDSIIKTYKNLNPGVIKLIEPVNIDDETYANIWVNEKYNGLTFDNNDTTAFYSDKGERMRSKSEVLIANALNRKNIFYKYEMPVTRKNGELLYPDFTVLNVKKRRVIYWEHLGKMDDMSYVSRNIWKLAEYKKLGIYLGVNLFVTTESSNSALGTDEIQKIIDHIDSD